MPSSVAWLKAFDVPMFLCFGRSGGFSMLQRRKPHNACTVNWACKLEFVVFFASLGILGEDKE